MLYNHLVWEDIKNKLNAITAMRSEWVIPAELECLPHNPYVDHYGWMFTLERSLIKWWSKCTSKHIMRCHLKALFGVGGGFSEGLSNAFVHGNLRNPEWPISIQSACNDQSIGFSIKDSGRGFVVPYFLACLKKGDPIFTIAGNGLNCLHTQDQLIAGFSESGTRLNIFFEHSL